MTFKHKWLESALEAKVIKIIPVLQMRIVLYCQSETMMKLDSSYCEVSLHVKQFDFR